MATIATGARELRQSKATDWSPAQLFHLLGSLKLTVGLFAVSVVIVLVGTLAQDEMNMLEVKQRYFLSWIAWLHFDDFFPQAFYPHTEKIPGIIPFPGGALVGLLLLVNLVAAKATRFRLQAKGGGLLGGLGFMAAGSVVAGLIIASGHNAEGLQGTPPITYGQLWGLVLAMLAALSVGLVVAGVRRATNMPRTALFVAAAIAAALVIFSLATGYRVGDPGLRIVWQLTKGLGAGLILLVGCLILFGKQGGNVLLHLGVGLLMVGQFVFGDRQLEQRLTLVEGQSTNTFVNLDETELTFIHREEGVDHVVAVPASRLAEAEGSDERIVDDSLPVAIEVLEFYENAGLQEGASPENLANTGIGEEFKAVERPKSGGTDSEVNLAAAYIQLFDKESDESLGKYLVSQQLNDFEVMSPSSGADDLMDEVAVGGKNYGIGLRLHREVKPYWVQLEDVRRIDYSGSNTPRDYSSFIRIVDKDAGEDRRERVWMNNPLRYRGETFYQSSYRPLPGGKELTGIQVVRNSGWLIPYLACSITGLGMLVHFWGTLTRFLGRRRRETTKEQEFNPAFSEVQSSPWPALIAGGGFALLSVIMLAPHQAIYHALRPAERAQAFDFHTFGQIPVQFGGRVMPMDAYARQTVKAISNKESLPLDTAPGDIKQRAVGDQLAATQWLMEVATGDPKIYYLPMFRIDAEEVLSELELKRKESKLYSFDEISENEEQVRPQTQVAFEKQENNPEALTFKEKKLIELELRKRQFLTAAVALRTPQIQPFPEEQFPDASAELRQRFMARQLQEIAQQMQRISKMDAPSIVPPTEETAEQAVDQPDWEVYAAAKFEAWREQAMSGEPAREPVDAFGNLIAAYDNDEPDAFNESTDRFLSAVSGYPIPGYSEAKVSLEHWMSSNHPTTVATAIYVLAIVMGLVYFAIDSERLRRAVWGTLLVALIIHTITLASRIYITGRAPVINIYSSAVFVGWAAVLFGLVVERIFRYGTGNMLAAVAGMLTLRVAYGLDKGDTMPVLQAVLDTQFWLSTHVISVSLGYVATLVAGTLGIGYLIANWLGKGDKPLRDLYRCTYGAACFGILFSFIGTVLGGLWADDSWGRFWGWDPKENGALLIVIWNALMLHARWDGMVKARGFAILAIGGNVVTAWSWFGTNELGIGLHSYGFTEGVLMWLSIFILSQIAFIIAGLAFTRRPGPTLE